MSVYLWLRYRRTCLSALPVVNRKPSQSVESAPTTAKMSELRKSTLRSPIGGDSRLTLEDLGRVAGLYDVSLRCDYPRNVVNLQQIMDAPCTDYL